MDRNDSAELGTVMTRYVTVPHRYNHPSKQTKPGYHVEMLSIDMHSLCLHQELLESLQRSSGGNAYNKARTWHLVTSCIKL